MCKDKTKVTCNNRTSISSILQSLYTIQWNMQVSDTNLQYLYNNLLFNLGKIIKWIKLTGAVVKLIKQFLIFNRWVQYPFYKDILNIFPVKS
jgi:hypothetical protein